MLYSYFNDEDSTDIQLARKEPSKFDRTDI